MPSTNSCPGSTWAENTAYEELSCRSLYLDGCSLVDCAPGAAGHLSCGLRVGRISIKARLRPEPRWSIVRSRTSGSSATARLDRRLRPCAEGPAPNAIRPDYDATQAHLERSSVRGCRRNPHCEVCRQQARMGLPAGRADKSTSRRRDRPVEHHGACARRHRGDRRPRRSPHRIHTSSAAVAGG